LPILEGENMKIKWIIEDFIAGYSLERLEWNSTSCSCVKYGIKLAIKEIRERKRKIEF